MRRVYSTLATLCVCSLLFSQNPQMLKDVFPGNNSGTIQNIVKTSGYTFFNEDDDDADTDPGLFRTDGTTAGTIKLNLTYPGYLSTKAEKLTALGNKVIFAGDNFQTYGEIWSSDGTQAGTIALERFQPVSNRIPVGEIKAMGSYAYYSIINKDAGGVNHAYLRRTDGTAAGTSLVYDFSAFTGVPEVVFLTPVNNILYFIVYDAQGTGVDQLWRSDGTSAGTYMVYNFTTANFVESFIMPAGNTMYLMIGSVVGGVRQNTIWKSDGTTAGTVPVKLVGTGNTNIYPPFAAIGNTLYFAGVDGSGKELWKTDGTDAGTFRVADINPGAANSNPAALTGLNGNLFFAAFEPTNGGELWKYDGTNATLVKDINPGAANSGPANLMVSGNTIVFAANNGVNGGELWITDGTAKNTVMVSDINPGGGNSVPNTFTGGNPVYFAANNGTNGFEVFKYDNNGDVLGGPHKFYVNDNSLSGDVFTASIGNNNNNGSKAYPFATISYAVSQVQAGDSIYVDAGTYIEQVTIDKGIVIIGAGRNLTSVIKPSTINPPPGPFTEPGVIQTSQNIGDVHIKDLSVTGDAAGVVPIILQTGGSIKNCNLISGNQGVFVRIDPATNPSAKAFILENSTVSAEYIAVNFAGTNLTASLINNELSASNSGFSTAVFAGLDFGTLPNLTATGNKFSNYVSNAFLINANNSTISQNSFLGSGAIAIEKIGGNTLNATCNWWGSSDQYIIASKIHGNVNFSPWLINGTDNDPGTIGFQPVPNSCEGRQLFYVNDNSLTGDVYTTAVGNNANSGSSSAPLATITAALAKAQAGDIILVDAGTYTEQVNINKGITIKGAGKTLTIINGPAAPIAELPDWGEKGIIQSRAGIGDVTIDGLLIDGTNSDELHSIMIQGGGRVLNCEMRNANNGIFFRHISTQPRTAIAYNNHVHDITFVGIMFAGNGLTAEASGNVINLNGAAYGMGFLSGWGGDGNVASFTASNNTVINFNGFGFMIGSLQSAQVHDNSITRISGNIFQNANSGVTINATCNWFGTADAALIIPYIDPASTYSPWLSNGTDNDLAMGFQPLPNSCNGRQNKLYVNDNDRTGDVFTTSVGNDGNSGIPSAPLLTLSAAFTKAQAGDSIFIDAGTYITPNLNLNKSITILGSNYLINPNNATNALLPNTSRNAESKITGSTFTIGASNISIEGLTLDPGAKQQVTTLAAGINNFTFKRNYSRVTSSTFLTFTGPTIPNDQIPAYGNYLIENNRFEKIGTGSAIGITISYLNDVWVNRNVFITEAPATLRLMVNCYAGFGGTASNFKYSNNTSQASNYDLFTFSLISGIIENNTCLQSLRPLFIQSVAPGSSDIRIRNNYLESDFAINTPIYYLSADGALSGASTNVLIEGNTVVQNCTGKNFALLAIRAQMPGTAQNTSLIINKNKLNYIGDYSLFTSSNVVGVNIVGKLQTVSLDQNEIEFNGTNLTNVLPTGVSSSGILISSDGGPANPFPSNAVMNITGNKIHGFRNSIAIYDAVNTSPNTYTGYGNLPEGVILNINNNSFTGDVFSINNGTTGAAIGATCNWYGTAAAQNIAAKVTSTVNYNPWLTSGTDSDIPAVGFQPAGLCNGTAPVITVNTVAHITCFGANNGSINISVSGGFAPYAYAWTKNEDEEFVSSTEDLTNLVPGTYHLTLTDANGSIADLEVTINEPALLTASATGSNNLCFGESNGTASVSVEGGTTPYTYLWSNGETTESISSLAAGVYSVTVTDDNGCTTTAQYQVTQPTQLAAIATGTSTSCANSATVSASGGAGGYTYLWSNGATTQSITSLLAGTYTVTVTDGNGCQTTASCTVTASEAFNPSASVVNVSCFGGNNGSITITNANATAPFQFSLNGVDFTIAQPMPFTFNNLAAGTYTVYVRDANGCTGFITKTISQPPVLTAALGIIQSTCYGQSTGSIPVTVTGGTGGLNYSWTGPNGYTSTQKNISGLAAGNYHFTVTDANGCTQSLAAMVLSFGVITVNATVTNIACKGEVNGAISLNVTGGTNSGFTYFWSTGSTANAISNLGVANYNVTITDIGSGCVVTRTYSITQPSSAVNLSASKTNATSCSSLGTVTALGSGGTAPYTYSLNGGNYQSSGSFTGLYAGNYTVTVKDANGCTKTSAVLSITDSGGDDFESNNSKNQAKAISLSVTNAARIATATDVADWYKFTTTSAGSYTLTLSHPSASFSFNLYAAGNNTPALVPTGSAATTKVYSLAANTTYYISVTGALSYICYQFSIAPTSLLTKSASSNVQQELTKGKPANDVFDVTVFPNPSSNYFNVKIESDKDEAVNLRVMDASGRLIEEKKNMAPSQIVKFGERYINGVYLVEVIQGSNRKTLRIVKM